MVLIDANYIIRLFSQDEDRHYQESKNFFEKVAKKEVEVIISEGVLMECFFVLKRVYKYTKDEIIEMLMSILELQNVVNEDKAVLIYALNILKKHNIDFIDALLCAKANFYGYEVRSFDKDIQKCL